MPRYIRQFLQSLAERRRARRRQANLRAGELSRHGPALTVVRRQQLGAALRAPKGARLAGRTLWIALAGILVASAGGALIAGHARHLAGATISTPEAANNERAAGAFRDALPGASFTVSSQPGITTSLQPTGALLMMAGMQPAPAVRVDLCSQMRGPSDPRLLPLRLGYRFDDVQRWVARNQRQDGQVSLRNVLLVSDGGVGAEAMPEVQIDGVARADFADPLSEPLRLGWRSRTGDTRWISDASLGQVAQGQSAQVGLRQQGWLLWGRTSALRIERRANLLCPQAGELLLQVYRRATPAAADANALVTAFPARGRAVSAQLAAGVYAVPANGAAALEDQALFAALQEHRLVRLSAAGAIELAPRDLLQWLASDGTGRVAGLRGWSDVKADSSTLRLFKRLYYQADGAYVRQQIDIFNGERQLLAWRLQDAAGMKLDATASISPGVNADGGADRAPIPVPTTSQMPVAAARLFAVLPQGWQPWTRVARWPQAANSADSTDGQPVTRLTLSLPHAAQGGEVFRIMVAGRAATEVTGASAQWSDACTGRACRRKDDVQEIVLTLQPGARSVALSLRPLAFSTPEDEKYRHLRLSAGRLVWQPLSGSGSGPGGGTPRAAPPPVHLEDRNGIALWDDGAPTQAAADAGLAPLLGVSPDHAGSVAGMLARGASMGMPVRAKLTLDLPLQELGQRILNCVAMRHGRWDGKACSGGQPAPEGRHAGLVILDTETGDILAAAGAGTGEVSAANWSEVRDFDRTNPARSPLRLPALQHDGGAHQSPGSTFKVISALGLELAAQSDPQLDALLEGMPLTAINRVAAQRGFAFHTGAASYPVTPRLAHITNYREQGLDRRAQEGRLGLAQALTYSLNTWFAWSGELSDRSLFGRAEGGAPSVQALDADALDPLRPIVAAAHRLGFEQAMRLDGGLLPADFNWRSWDALQATPAHIDTIHTRHELRQMAIGLRMQVTPLQMALASAAIGQGAVVAPRMLLSLDGKDSVAGAMRPVGARLDRIRAGMKGVVDVGTGAGAFSAPALAPLRPGLYGKTGTAPTGDDTATVWFTGWLEPGTLPGQKHRLAMAAFVSHSDGTGGSHAAPVVAALLSTLAAQNPEKKGK